jgi:hypothetical protein
MTQLQHRDEPMAVSQQFRMDFLRIVFAAQLAYLPVCLPARVPFQTFSLANPRSSARLSYSNDASECVPGILLVTFGTSWLASATTENDLMV